ncbi:MAG: DUF3310 domain-containing protein [Acinetobacter sp.]
MKYKEFLNMKNGYTLEILPEHAGDDKESGLIEVPDGADVLKNTLHGGVFYRKNIDELSLPFSFAYVGDESWAGTSTNPHDEKDTFFKCTLWQRHTQPEELPFIDDNEKLEKIKFKVDGNIDLAIDKAKSMGYWNCQFEKIPSNAYWLLCNEDGTVDYSMIADIKDEYIEVADSSDAVNQPSHYTSHPSGIECIEITRHHDFAIGNAIKYLWRAGLKNSDNEVQDLEKAVWYIQDKIKQLKGN